MHLVIRDAAGAALSRHDAPADLARRLVPLGVALGRLAIDGRPGSRPTVADAPALAALHQRFGIRSADRLALTPGDTRWPMLRSRLRQRHSHADVALWVVLRGQGLFDIALPEGGRAQLLCGAGDWLALPAGLPHAFDAGRVPDVDLLRLVASADGWVTTPTADAAQAPLPDLDRLLAERRLLQPALAA